MRGRGKIIQITWLGGLNEIKKITEERIYREPNSRFTNEKKIVKIVKETDRKTGLEYPIICSKYCMNMQPIPT